MVEPVPEPALEHQRRQHAECNRHAERRVDDEDRRPGHRQIRERQQDLRPVDREAVEERVGEEREEREEQPAPSELTGPGVDADRRPCDHRRREDQHRDGMAVAAVPGEGGDRVRERPQDIEVREKPAEPSPQRRPPRHLAAECRFPHGGAEGNLGDGVQRARSAHAGAGRVGACSGGICKPRVSSSGHSAPPRPPAARSRGTWRSTAPASADSRGSDESSSAAAPGCFLLMPLPSSGFAGRGSRQGSVPSNGRKEVPSRSARRVRADRPARPSPRHGQERCR